MEPWKRLDDGLYRQGTEKTPALSRQQSGELRSDAFELLTRVQVFELSVGGARFLTEADIAVPESFGILFAHERCSIHLG